MIRRMKEIPETSDSSAQKSDQSNDWDLDTLPPFIVPRPVDSTRNSVSPNSTPSPHGVLRSIGPYQILRELGRGGMGVVYEAIEQPLNRRVALKVLPFSSSTDKSLVDRLLHEARIVARLDHPHIVKVYGSGEVDGVHYIAFQLIAGSNLCSQIGQSSNSAGPEAGSASNRWDRLATLGRDAANALQHAHDNGIIHRDVKPSNLLLDGGDKVWVADFGLARATGGAQLTATGDLLGTFRYMSPEQAIGQRGLIDARTDIYSLGVVLYELATHSPLFESEDRAALLRKVLGELPKPLRRAIPTIPRDLAVIIGKAISKYPSDRYATAADLAADLNCFLERHPIVAVPPSIWDWSRYYARKHRTLLTICLMGLFAVLLGWNLISRQHSHSLQEKIDQLDDARRQTTLRQWDTLLTLAERGLATMTPGRKLVSHKSLREAAQLIPPGQLRDSDRLRLRDNLIASLAVPIDLQRQHTVDFSGTVFSIAIDEDFQHALRTRPNTTLVEQYGSHGSLFLNEPGRLLETGIQNSSYYWISPRGHAAVLQEPTTTAIWDLSTGQKISQPTQCNSYAWSMDGQKIAFHYGDETIRIVESKTGTELANWKSTEQISDFAWLPEGEELGLIQGNKLVRVRATTGEILDQQPCPYGVSQLEWTADRRLALFKTLSGVIVWNHEKQSLHQNLVQEPVRQMIVPTHGDLIATVPLIGDSTLWNVRSGRKWIDVPDRVAAFHQGGGLLATCGNRSLSTWSIVRSPIYRAVHPRLHEYQELYDAGFSPDGRWLVTTGDAGISFTNLENRIERSIPRPGTRSGQFVRTGDLTSLLVSDSEVSVTEYPFDPATGELGEPRRLFPQGSAALRGVGHAQLAHGGDWLAVVDAVTRPVAIQRSSGRVVALEPRPNLWYASVSPDGHWVAAGTYQSRGLSVWDVESGKVSREFPEITFNSRCEFSPDGKWLAISSSHDFRVLSTSEWNVVFSRFSKDAYYTTGPFAFTPDGRNLLMSENQTELQLLATETWDRVATLTGPDEGVHGMARFSTDGHWLVRASGSEAHVWNIRALREELQASDLDW